MCECQASSCNCLPPRCPGSPQAEADRCLAQLRWHDVKLHLLRAGHTAITRVRGRRTGCKGGFRDYPRTMASEAPGGNATRTGFGRDYAWLRNLNLVSNGCPLQNLIPLLVMCREGQVLRREGSPSCSHSCAKYYGKLQFLVIG